MKAPTIAGFLRENSLADSSLILDGTGPGVTMHLPSLRAMGEANLAAFGAVHGFSGGALAFVVDWARSNGYLRHHADHYINHFDKQFRLNHHQGLWGPARALLNLIVRKPVFGEALLRRHIRYIFSDDFFRLPPARLPENFSLYLAVSGSGEPVQYNHDMRLKTQLDMETLLTATVSMPFAYGKVNGQYYDSVFAPQFKATYRNLTQSTDSSRLVLSMWKSGVKGQTTFVNPIGANGKGRLRSDIMRLMLNVSNPNYRPELALWLKETQI